jgi:hypothetical protein
LTGVGEAEGHLVPELGGETPYRTQTRVLLVGGVRVKLGCFGGRIGHSRQL